MSDILIADLFVMQECLRNTTQIPKMIEFVSNGGFWTNEVLEKFAIDTGIKKSPLMEIVKFPDGRSMIHDGHHRIVSIYLGKRDYVREDEFVVKYWNYSDYLDINLANKWVTPFDPVTEIRYPDIYTFKKQMVELLTLDKEKAIQQIRASKHLYAKPRTLTTVASLAETLKKS